MRWRAGAGTIALLLAVGAGGAAAAGAPKVVAVHDAKGDVAGPLDLTRVSLARTADGRLRASLTLAAAWDGSALLADAGPPGSVCLKVWSAAKPPDEPADYLVCATADASGALRGSVLHERPNRLPERVSGADVSRPSTRTVTLRWPQSAIGGPAAIAAAGETTRAGCRRVSCIDLAPEAPAVLRLVLHTG